jgi:phosphoglycolate phosphatase-like HAD superfamily hydrolase
VLTVGFDLDMTLVDSRPGIRASFAALTAETGVAVDTDIVCARLGPKLEVELANWFAADDVDEAAAIYRHHYAHECVRGTNLLPGAAAAVAEVAAHRGRTMVITAKSEQLAHVCLASVGLTVDIVVGYVHGEEKALALREHNADAYVGDTQPDIAAARAANAYAIGVATGSHTIEELYAAGAAIVLESLTEFPAAFRDHLLAS